MNPSTTRLHLLFLFVVISHSFHSPNPPKPLGMGGSVTNPSGTTEKTPDMDKERENGKKRNFDNDNNVITKNAFIDIISN